MAVRGGVITLISKDKEIYGQSFGFRILVAVEGFIRRPTLDSYLMLSDQSI